MVHANMLQIKRVVLTLFSLPFSLPNKREFSAFRGQIICVECLPVSHCLRQMSDSQIHNDSWLVECCAI